MRRRGFRVLDGGRLSVACARWEPEGVGARALDGLQSTIARRVVDSGRAWFSTVEHDGLVWMRLNLVNVHTREEHIRSLAAWIAEAAAAAR